MKFFAKLSFKIGAWLFIITTISVIVVLFTPDRISAIGVRNVLRENPYLLSHLQWYAEVGNQGEPFREISKALEWVSQVAKLTPILSVQYQEALETVAHAGKVLGELQLLSNLHSELKQVNEGGLYPMGLEEQCQQGVEALNDFEHFLGNAQTLIEAIVPFITPFSKDEAQNLQRLNSNLSTLRQQIRNDVLSLKRVQSWGEVKYYMEHSALLVVFYGFTRFIRENALLFYIASFGLLGLSVVFGILSSFRKTDLRKESIGYREYERHEELEKEFSESSQILATHDTTSFEIENKEQWNFLIVGINGDFNIRFALQPGQKITIGKSRFDDVILSGSGIQPFHLLIGVSQERQCYLVILVQNLHNITLNGEILHKRGTFLYHKDIIQIDGYKILIK